MRGGRIFTYVVAACGLVLTAWGALADHIPGHDDCDPEFPVPMPGQEFFDGGVLFVTFIGPLADNVITSTTFDITWVSDGATPASDLFIEIAVQVDQEFREFSVTGADLGFGSGPGTFHGTLQTKDLNGVVWPGFPGPNSIINATVDVVGGGGIQGSAYFLDSFITFDVIPPPPCPSLGCGTGGACAAGQDCVTECGELVQGVACVLFLADSGGLYLLEDLGSFGVGDRVEVTGCLDPGCFTICLEGDGCIFQNTINACVHPFQGCGELVQGAECVLFQADAGGLYLLEDLGSFGVGDRVFVNGVLDESCVTICLEGDGCIFGNTISDCVEDQRVTICHMPPGNSGNPRTITISANALAAHLAHGDTIGPCNSGLRATAEVREVSVPANAME
jgi:hypothetical protein